MKTKIILFFILYSISSCTNYYYKKALKDAYVPLQKEETATLTEIKKSNPQLIWKNINGEDYVLVVSWKSAAAAMYYVNNKASGVYNTGNYPLFVTAVPDLKNWYKHQKKLHKADPSKRIKQLLGISPDTTFKFQYFVEFWVQPKDLVRPCFDPEVSDNTCTVNLLNKPADGKSLIWVTKYFYGSYSNPNFLKNFPFTRLGYTYDWHPKNKKHIGLSEFVIPANKNIVVEKVISTPDYFKQ